MTEILAQLSTDSEWIKLAFVGIVVLISIANGIAKWFKERVEQAKERAQRKDGDVDYEIVMGSDGEPTLRPVNRPKAAPETAARRGTTPVPMPAAESTRQRTREAQQQKSSRWNPPQTPVARGMTPPRAPKPQQPRPRPPAPQRPRAEAQSARPPAQSQALSDMDSSGLYRAYTDAPLSEVAALIKPAAEAQAESHAEVAAQAVNPRTRLFGAADSPAAALRRAIVLNEVLGPPVALRAPG